MLLTNNVATAASAKRLAALAAEYPASSISALVDCAAHVDTLESAAAASGVTIGALIEIECGQKRCGCEAAGDGEATQAPWASVRPSAKPGPPARKHTAAASPRLLQLFGANWQQQERREQHISGISTSSNS